MSFELSRPIAAVIFILAALTDWLDGWVAREFDQTSKLGAFLDPVADKLIVSVALILIVQSDPTILNSVIAAIIIGREIAVSALREWMSELGASHQVTVTGYAKLKTVFQMFGLSFMLFKIPVFGIPIYLIGKILLVAAGVLTLWTMLVYLVKAWPVILKNE
jgi:CDP-diacylglycerol--glycerol-3-phosphate 3-phosphatidyltransferase